uniref:Peptidase_S8 domain-containing protein n=1 Tax=Heterorhabditis bacteriophora TaxID=37862 RepID=A0A1I7XQ03_HETBA
MTTLPKVLTTTTEQCPNRLINQNIAFVFELSNSTGDLSASQATSTFILNYLINQNQFNDQFSSFSLIPFPNPASYEAYGSIQDFDHLKKHNFDVALSFLFTVFNTNGTYEANRSISDINGDSGLVTAQETARDLKASNVTILTVAVTNEKSFSLTSLASSPNYIHSGRLR